ncbi:signal peptidase II [Granulicoccus sp. GXG6511]|uniref:signal peptidase II n=1 Tax=Granulicoccus sp. GXG6511 TaxID=3381351 RepID=UPI003D7C4CDF
MTDSVLPRRSAWTRFALVAVSILVLDVVTKVAAVAWLRPGEPVPVLGDLLRLYLIRNPGAAFSIGEGMTWIFTLLAVVVLGFLLAVVVPGLRHGGWSVGLGLVAAGITGNLIDRLFREPGFARGHVVDFLQLPYWPIFNVADMGVVFGAITIVFFWLVKGVGHDGVLEKDREEARRSSRDVSREATGE